MARKKNVIAPDAQMLETTAQIKNDNLSLMRKVFDEFGMLGGEYNRLVYVQTGKHIKELHEKSGTVLGAVIQGIKDNEDHGSFLKALEEISIHPRKAQRYMNIARRYGKYDNLSHLNASKLDILDMLTDPELELLEAGEQVKGLTLDAIDNMTAKEAKERLRKAEEESNILNRKVKSLESMVQKKSQKIDDLQHQINLDPPTPERERNKLLEDFKKKLFEHILMVQFYLDEAVKVVVQAQKVEGATFPQLQEWAKAHYEQLAPISDLYDELDQALNNCCPDKPDSTGM